MAHAWFLSLSWGFGLQKQEVNPSGRETGLLPFVVFVAVTKRMLADDVLIIRVPEMGGN